MNQEQVNRTRYVVATLSPADYHAWVGAMSARYDALAANDNGVAALRKPRDGVMIGIIDELTAVASLRASLEQKGPLPSATATFAGGVLRQRQESAAT